ncbi:Galactomannan galactosyltransferase 1 [Camellia lanceoleosa]|uniref:Galactomannan galactosyltransferase 1 n=1 Tax=Camellia lanceoleosa TaxID=1840588 RepID=A0ACC0IQ38_9ERIC|nr:Galactomannan galactosyltransferase 1 [Camellia lanceoleosa]
MGPQTPNCEKWGQIFTSTLTDKMYPVSDDQSTLVYLLLKEKDKWGRKIYVENQYTLSGYWAGIVDSLDRIEDSHDERRENGVSNLRRRHAEKVSEAYVEEEGDGGGGRGGVRRPFVTHFTGCQPCSGDHPGYTDEACWNGMERALNFADNQVFVVKVG